MWFICGRNLMSTNLSSHPLHIIVLGWQGWPIWVWSRWYILPLELLATVETLALLLCLGMLFLEITLKVLIQQNIKLIWIVYFHFKIAGWDKSPKQDIISFLGFNPNVEFNFWYTSFSVNLQFLRLILTNLARSCRSTTRSTNLQNYVVLKRNLITVSKGWLLLHGTWSYIFLNVRVCIAPVLYFCLGKFEFKHHSLSVHVRSNQITWMLWVLIPFTIPKKQFSVVISLCNKLREGGRHGTTLNFDYDQYTTCVPGKRNIETFPF